MAGSNGCRQWGRKEELQAPNQMRHRTHGMGRVGKKVGGGRLGGGR